MLNSIRFLAAVLALAVGCSNGASDTGADLVTVDAGHHGHAEASCETGRPPCAEGTCTDFGVFGGKLCATSCARDADCANDFVCVADANDHGICAPPQFGGPAGAYPDLICYDMDQCNVQWGANQNGCTAYLDTCLGGLTAAQREEWQNAVAACLRQNNTCSGLFGTGSAGCYASVPWC